MSFFSSLGKIILGLVIVGVLIGGISMYFLFSSVDPVINKLATLDKINYELEKSGETKISMNILNGEVSRE